MLPVWSGAQSIVAISSFCLIHFTVWVSSKSSLERSCLVEAGLLLLSWGGLHWSWHLLLSGLLNYLGFCLAPPFLFECLARLYLLVRGEAPFLAVPPLDLLSAGLALELFLDKIFWAYSLSTIPLYEEYCALVVMLTHVMFNWGLDRAHGGCRFHIRLLGACPVIAVWSKKLVGSLLGLLLIGFFC